MLERAEHRLRPSALRRWYAEAFTSSAHEVVRASRTASLRARFARAPLVRLLRYARAHRAQIWVASICSVLNKLFDLAPPLLIGAAVDIVVERDGSFVSRLGVSSVEGQLWVLAGLTVIIWGGESLFEFLLDYRWRTLAQTMQHELRMDAYRNVERLAPEQLEDKGVGGVVCILNDDINQLERFLDGSANQLVQLATTLLVLGSMFVSLVPSVAWMTFVPMPVVVWASIRFQTRLAPLYVSVRAHAGRLASVLSRTLHHERGARRSDTRDEPSPVELESREYLRANEHAIRVSSAFVPLLRMVVVTGFVAMLIYGGKLALSGKLKLGAYSVIVSMTQNLLWPLVGLGELLDRYRRAMASTARALDLLDRVPVVTRGES